MLRAMLRAMLLTVLENKPSKKKFEFESDQNVYFHCSNNRTITNKKINKTKDVKYNLI